MRSPMISCHAFRQLSGLHQVRTLSCCDEPVVELERPSGTTLFYRLLDGYAELCFEQRPTAHLLIGCFQESDSRFDELVSILPVDVGSLLRS
jgi:hypothetical protein